MYKTYDNTTSKNSKKDIRRRYCIKNKRNTFGNNFDHKNYRAGTPARYLLKRPKRHS